MQLYQDEIFLDALPTSERLGAPAGVRLAHVGDAEVLEEAVLSSAALDQRLAPLLASAEALRSEPPNRTRETVRSWPALPVTHTTLDGQHLWWVRGDIVQPDAGADLTWTIEAAADRSGAWETLVTGSHDPGGSGTIDWLAAGTPSALGPEIAHEAMSIRYEDPAGVKKRSSEYAASDILASSHFWEVEADYGLVFTSAFTLTEDGLSWPGTVRVWHFEDEGGRALGYLYKEPEVPIAFETCWDAQGVRQWAAGASDITAMGDATSCRAPAFDDR